MLPDFPRIKHRWLSEWLRNARASLRQGPLMSQINTVHHFEGDALKTTDATGETEESTYKTLTDESRIDCQDLINRGPDYLVARLEEIPEELKRQQSTLVFERIDEITTRTGNVVDAAGQDLTPDLYLRALENIDIDFSEDGDPQLPTLVASPELGERLKAKMREWETDQCYRRKRAELIKRKRQEWRVRESRRKLVD